MSYQPQIRPCDSGPRAWGCARARCVEHRFGKARVSKLAIAFTKPRCLEEMGTRVACPAPLTARRAHRSFVGERLALTTCTRRQSQTQHWRLSSAARKEVSAARVSPKREAPFESLPPAAAATSVPGKVAPTTAASGSAPITSPVTAAAAPKALSQTDKFQPWFRQLEAELLAVALDLVRETTGARVDSGAEDVTEEEEEARADEERRMQRTLGQAGYETRRLGQLQQLGQRMGKLAQLLAHDVLPKFPQDPEALFLCASADFLTRKFDAALRAMQRSLLATPEGHCTARELAARHYFVALIAMRIATEAQDPQLKGDEAKPLRPTLPARRRVELEGIIERGLSECMRLDPRHHSAYVDSEMLAELRYPNDAHAKVPFPSLSASLRASLSASLRASLSASLFPSAALIRCGCSPTWYARHARQAATGCTRSSVRCTFIPSCAPSRGGS